MKPIVRNKLFEDPDTSYAKDSQPLRWDDNLAHPFGSNIAQDMFDVGPPGGDHATVGKEDDLFALNDYLGRIWPEAGVIAFWEAPPKRTLLNILQKLIDHDEISVYGLEMEDFEDFLFDIPNPDQTSDDEDAYFTLSEYPDNPAIDHNGIEFKVKERPQHTVSPMNKTPQKVKVSDNIGKKVDDRNAWRRAKPFESVVRPTVNESPDTMCATPQATVNAWGKYQDSWHCSIPDDKVAAYDSEDARPFGIIDVDDVYGRKVEKGEFWVGAQKETHEIGRWRYKYAGRIWMNKKLISFWEYPPPRKMKEFLDTLADKLGEKIGMIPEGKEKLRRQLEFDFLIEIIEKGESADEEKEIWKTKHGKWDTWGDNPHTRFTTKYIKVKDYANLTSVKQLSKEDREGEHQVSPMLKKKRAVPQGFGSKHPKAEVRAEERRNKPFESALPKKKWTKVDPEPFSDELINLVQTAYKNTPEGSFINTKRDVMEPDWLSIDFDENPDIDATIFYREARPNETWQGKKIQGLGHDGSKAAIGVMFNKFKELLNTNGVWVEGSDAVEHILYKMNVEYVDNEELAQRIFPDSNLKFIGDRGKYTRSIGSKEIKETIFGKPQLKVNESFYPQLNENPNATIDPKIWNEFKDQPYI